MSAATLALVIVLPLLVTAVVALYRTSSDNAPQERHANEHDEEHDRRARLIDSGV